jgi:hypothetical protein
MALSTIAHHKGAALCLHLSVHSYAQSWICVHAYPNRTALRASPLVHTGIAHRPSALHVLRECFDPQPRSRTSRQAIRQLMVLLYACGRARVRQCRIGAPGQANNTQRVRVQVAGACEGNRGTPAQLWFLQGPQPASKPHIPWCCCAPRGLMTLKTPPARIAKFLAVAAGLPTPCPSAAPLAEPTDPSYTCGSPTSTRASRACRLSASWPMQTTSQFERRRCCGCFPSTAASRLTRLGPGSPAAVAIRLAGLQSTGRVCGNNRAAC